MTRYVGIDASSKSIAFGLIDEVQLLSYGEVFFTAPNFDQRLNEAKNKMKAFLPHIATADYIVFERVILGPNREVALKLAQMFGVLKAELLEAPGRLVEAPPMVWQEDIGNPVFRGKARTEFLKLHPEWKTRSQQNTGIRNHRKTRTHDIVQEAYGVDIQSDNVTDSIGLAMFGEHRIRT